MRRFFVLSFLFISAPAAADTQEIVITGKGLAPGVDSRVYGDITLNRDEIISSPSNRLETILGAVPGFQLFRRSDARSANPTSQGATLRALGGNASSRALVLLDGVPQSDPFGGWINWPSLDPQRFGEIRVVRGGGSGVSGPGALAGTIELASASIQDLAPFSGRVSYGSRDSVEVSASGATAVGSSFASLAGSYSRGPGFIPVIEEQRGPVDRASPYRQGNLAARVVAPVGAAELQLNATIFEDVRERGTAFSRNETSGRDASARLVGPDWSLLGYFQQRDYYNSFASVSDRRDSVSQVSEQYDVPSTGLGARGEYRPTLGPVEFRVGMDWRRADGETREYYNLASAAGPNRRKTGGATDVLGAFAEGTWQRDALTLTFGGRLDRWWINNGFLREEVVRTGITLNAFEYDDRAGWRPTFRSGMAYEVADNVTLRSAAYAGWRLPTLNELYRPFRVRSKTTLANAALQPERLKGIEAGMEVQPSDGTRLSLTAFWNRLEDGIANLTVGPDLDRRGNLDRLTSKGIEVDGEARMGDFLLRGGYSYADAKVKSSGLARALDGLRPAQTPAHSASASLSWVGQASRVALLSRYVSRQFEDDLNLISLPDALTFDAFASYALAPGLAVELRAENLTDRRVVAAISSDGLIERAMPRTFWIALSIKS